MFRVRRTRAFTAGPYAWTIHVECQAPRLNADGYAEGVDFNPFWRWIGEHIYGGVTDEQGDALWPGGPEDIGGSISVEPSKWTAERFAFLLLTEFRNLSTAVCSVRVLRDPFDGRASSVHDCTVTAADVEPVTASELVAALRSYNDALRESSPAIVRELLSDWQRRFTRLNGLTAVDA